MQQVATTKVENACKSDSCRVALAIDDAVENLRGLTSIIKTLSTIDVTLGADPVNVLRDIGTLAKLASIEAETAAGILAGD